MKKALAGGCDCDFVRAIRASNFALLHRINTLYGEVNKFLV